MWRLRERPKAPALQVLFAVLGLLLVFGLYLLLMQLTVHSNSASGTRTTSERDTFYAFLHLAMLVVALAGGFALGKWLNGLGVAYAVLFVLVMAFGMVLAQLGGHTLACRGHNDWVRHWTC
jgi:hypothetical protein